MPHRRTLLLALLLALSGCGGAQTRPADPAPLLKGAESPAAPTRLNAARAIAGRFANAYAAFVYDPSPPPLPGATTIVNRAIRSAAARIPPPRLGRRARALTPTLLPEAANRIRAAATISDGRSPPFSVGFTIARRHGRWLVTQISPPG